MSVIWPTTIVSIKSKTIEEARDVILEQGRSGFESGPGGKKQTTFATPPGHYTIKTVAVYFI